MIYLYHGTDTEFETPIPERGRRGTDFGQGFYLTPHLDSAVNMVHRVARRSRMGGGNIQRPSGWYAPFDILPLD